MNQPQPERVIFGEAQVIAFSANFDAISYTIHVSDVMIESMDAVEPMADLVVSYEIPMKTDSEALTWLKSPVLKLMQKSWQEQEKDCMFFKQENTYDVLMSFCGYPMLFPLPMSEAFANAQTR
jgi:hypothetical protein